MEGKVAGNDDKAEAREPIVSLREPLGPIGPIPKLRPPSGQLTPDGWLAGLPSGQLPTGEFRPAWTQAKELIAGLAHISEHCRHTGRELERLLGELQGMIGKLPL